MWDDIAGDYRAADGWIKLHTNAVLHKKAALSVLGCKNNRKAVEQAVGRYHAAELEAAILQAGGCAAQMRSLTEWKNHPQGRSVAEEPLIAWEEHGHKGTLRIANSLSRPLNGVKVLDLTRVIAGPVATRFLAAYGAEVLRIDPVNLWDDSANAPEMSLGKRCAGLDLTDNNDRAIFEKLLSGADIFIHGYRPGALRQLGFDEQSCRRINPNLNIVSLCAYGWSGPWAARRGFDSLVQMSSGIAEAGMRWKHSDAPYPLPVQALDHATGYLMAAAALQALKEKAESGKVLSAKLSLAKTAEFLAGYRAEEHRPALDDIADADFSANIEYTPWGPARRLKFPISIIGCEATWPHPAGKLRSDTPRWA